MYPDAEYCDYLFYTSVFASSGHIEAAKDPVSWDVFQRRGPKYKLVQLGISFDFQNVTPNGLDSAFSDLDALRKKGIRHYGLLTVLSFQKDFRHTVRSTKGVLQKMKEIQHEETAKLVLAIGTYDFANIYRLKMKQGFRDAVKNLEANIVILIASAGWISPQGACVAAPPNPVKSFNQQYFDLLCEPTNVADRTEEYLGSPTFTYGIISNSSKVLTLGELNNTLALKRRRHSCMASHRVPSQTLCTQGHCSCKAGNSERCEHMIAMLLHVNLQGAVFSFYSIL
ncbi:uncharacterized protein LOC142769271 isoform X3 [Rhipicephalus microplus]|uniref:uncharacterized protein LOC142769271 isoform X3 n=1 Tax=Rhipicephalus microplus TaxID=6941 RepID=UPI003F6D2CEE